MLEKLLSIDIPGGESEEELSEDQKRRRKEIEVARQNVRNLLRRNEAAYRQHEPFIRMTSKRFREFMECVADYITPSGEKITGEQILERGFDPGFIKNKATGIRASLSFTAAAMRSSGSTDVSTKAGTNPNVFMKERSD